MESLMAATIFALFFLLRTLDARYSPQDIVSTTITVDHRGKGHFLRVQQAIDSVPPNNVVWTRILISPGVYFEKVVIPREKPYIILEGNPRHLTTIEFGDAGSSATSSTFELSADNFVARHIVFKNVYDHLIEPIASKRTTWAPAALIQSDKASFYQCSFVSLQDTLTDFKGRHYFYNCFIEGAMDFIWGNGQSIYEKCQIHTLSDKIGGGCYITAQGRDSPNDTTGFVFKDCNVFGTGPILLGRAYRQFARVFASTNMENNINPEGWLAWHYSGSENLITFSEVGCTGRGADMRHRVKWEKQLPPEEVAFLTNTASFIDQDGWLGRLLCLIHTFVSNYKSCVNNNEVTCVCFRWKYHMV
ncbi:hypothetical protein ACFX2J_027283 [Malus domestica]